MEDHHRRKRRWVDSSVKPNALALANFSHKYMSYLLPALLRVASLVSLGGNKGNKIKKIIRFEVDMALVLSTGEFRWSRALRHRLEQGMGPRKLHYNVATFESNTAATYINVELLGQFLATPSIPRPVVHVEAQMKYLKPNSKPDEASRIRTTSRQQGVQRKESRREEEIDGHIKMLRLLLPGGNEMELSELLSDVGSYVVCLQLQVNVLRSLIGTD